MNEANDQGSKLKSANFNWYPGHIAKAERQLRDKIKLVDIVIEIRDARIPESSTHKNLDEWVKIGESSKPIISILNKSDLADPNILQSEYEDYLQLNSQKGDAVKKLISKIEKTAEPMLKKFYDKGLRNKPIRVMVVGYPNVGKSSLINKISNSKKAKVQNKPGVTRQQQWIKINPKIHLLDTPGIIPSKLYSEDQAYKLALCSCLGENAYDNVELAKEAIKITARNYPGLIRSFYKLEDQEQSTDISDTEALKTIEETSLKMNWLKAPDDPDIDRTGNKIIQDIRSGRIGKICLD